MLNTYYVQYCGRYHWGGKKNEGNPSEIHYFYCSSYPRQRERSGDHPTPTPQCLRGSWNTRQSPNSENTVVQIHRCLKIFPTNKYMSSECSVQKHNRSKLLSQTRQVELLQHQEFNDHQGYLQGQVQACLNIAGFCQRNPSQRLRKAMSVAGSPKNPQQHASHLSAGRFLLLLPPIPHPSFSLKWFQRLRERCLFNTLHHFLRERKRA